MIIIFIEDVKSTYMWSALSSQAKDEKVTKWGKNLHIILLRVCIRILFTWPVKIQKAIMTKDSRWLFS